MQSSDFQSHTALFLAAVFALYGLVATALLAVALPPFQNPDEPNHFLRAAQLADGGLVGHWLADRQPDGSVSSGGIVDPAVMEAFAPFDALLFHPQIRATRAMWAPGIHWSRARAPMFFPNTAVYPPLFYLPSALGVRIGRAARLSVVQTLVVSRLLTGVTSVALGAVAIGLADSGAVWLFALLTLPMSLSLMASTAQDGMLLASGALAAALLIRGMAERTMAGAPLWLVVTLCLVVSARPPYAVLALLPLALAGMPWRWRILAAACVGGAAVAWSAIAAATALTNTGGFVGADPPAQAALLLANPLNGARAVWQTLVLNWPGYVQSFVGVLGWLDTVLPPPYYTAATVMLGVAALAAMLAARGPGVHWASRLLVAASLAAAFVAVFVVQYLVWTVPGHPTIDGVQGRYFCPWRCLPRSCCRHSAQHGWRGCMTRWCSRSRCFRSSPSASRCAPCCCATTSAEARLAHHPQRWNVGRARRGMHDPGQRGGYVAHHERAAIGEGGQHQHADPHALA